MHPCHTCIPGVKVKQCDTHQSNSCDSCSTAQVCRGPPGLSPARKPSLECSTVGVLHRSCSCGAQDTAGEALPQPHHETVCCTLKVPQSPALSAPPPGPSAPSWDGVPSCPPNPKRKRVAAFSKAAELTGWGKALVCLPRREDSSSEPLSSGLERAGEALFPGVASNPCASPGNQGYPLPWDLPQQCPGLERRTLGKRKD